MKRKKLYEAQSYVAGQKAERKKIWNRIAGVGLTLIGIWWTYFFIQGFVELIENQTAGVITFYGLVAVFVIWRLGDFLKFSLNMVFNQEVKE